jgi:hypothetical protein
MELPERTARKVAESICLLRHHSLGAPPRPGGGKVISSLVCLNLTWARAPCRTPRIRCRDTGGPLSNGQTTFHVARSRQVLLGSMLRPEVERLNAVDLAVQLEAKEKDIDRLRAQTLLRVEESATPDFPYQFGANGGNTFSRIGSTAARLHQPQPGSSLHPISKRHIISPPSNGRGQSARVAVAAVDCAEPRRRGT